MGASSIKYFPMKGLAHKAEYQAVAEACAANDFYLEPTGGIDLENFEEILQIAVDAGVKNHSHIYSSIIDGETGTHALEMYDISRNDEKGVGSSQIGGSMMRIGAYGEVMMRLTPPEYRTLEQTHSLRMDFTGTGSIC